MIKLKTTYKSVPERQPGARWTTKRYGEFEIIGKIDDGTGKRPFYSTFSTRGNTPKEKIHCQLSSYVGDHFG